MLFMSPPLSDIADRTFRAVHRKRGNPVPEASLLRDLNRNGIGFALTPPALSATRQAVRNVALPLIQTPGPRHAPQGTTMVLRRGTAGPGAAASVTSAHRDEQQQQQQPPRASRRGRNRSSSSPAAMVALGGAAALGLLLLAAGPADAYSLLPGGSRLPYSARAWGSFRHRLGLGGPRAGTPATAQAAGKPKTLLAPLQSATAPSPPKAAPEAGGPAPAPAELLMDELGDLELEIKTKIEVRCGSPLF